MKKHRLFLLLIICIGCLLVGCSNPSNSTGGSSSENDGEILWEKSENGYTEKIKLLETSEDGIQTKAITYTILEDATEKGVGFGILKIESNNNIVYKGAIIARRKTAAFPSGFWTHYKISCGQNRITMSDAVCAPDEEDGYYEYIVLGGISETQLTALKNANQLVISLLNPSDSTRNTTFACDYNFITNLIKYF